MEKTLRGKMDYYGSRWIDRMFWFLLGAFCLAYSVFFAQFAELHISLPFLDFPIFVGEILFCVCFVLFFLRLKFVPIKIEWWHYFAAGYIAWILVKSLWGYGIYGPLAFRTAALFYYALFAILTYTFFRRELFTGKAVLFLLVVISAARIVITSPSYYQLPHFGLMAILIWSARGWPRYCFFALLSFFLLGQNFFRTSKTALVGHLMSFSFLAYCFFYYFLNIKRIYKILLLVFIFIFGVTALVKFGNRNQVLALVKFTEVFDQFQQTDEYLKTKRVGFKPQILTPRLYNPESLTIQDRVNFEFSQWNMAPEQEVKKWDEKSAAALIDRKAEVARIALVRGINMLKDIKMSEIKASISSESNQKQTASLSDKEKAEIEALALKNQKQAVSALEEAAEEAILKAENYVRQEKQAAIEKARAYLEEREEKPAPTEQIKEDIVKLSDIPVREVVAAYSEKINQAPGGETDAHNKEVNDGQAQKEGQEFNPWGDNPDTRTAQKEVLDNTELFVKVYEKPENVTSPEGYRRSVRQEQGNMLFRLLIWRDMFKELTEKPWQAFWGINFGKPQRSISLELLAAGYNEWTRDGWITPHNSYFNMVYRGGIVGMAMALGLFWCVLTLAKSFIRQRSVKGLLLVAILIYWLVVSNFLVILELPHYAIPFWSLLGMTLAYRREILLSSG